MRELMIVAASLLMAPVAASAAPADTLVVQANRQLSSNQIAVRYGDLQLASVSGQRALEQRVGMAISELCDVKKFSVAEPHGSMRCTAQAWNDVRPRLSALTARFASR